jgi:hypothetical protein
LKATDMQAAAAANWKKLDGFIESRRPNFEGCRRGCAN